MYELIARQILNDYGITRGVCLDIGAGFGYLGIQLARQSNLTVCLVDIDCSVLEFARVNAERAGLIRRVKICEADVTELPFSEGVADLVVSYGSIWFWHDQLNGVKEIYRVMKPGGLALVGDGVGRNLPGDVRNRLLEVKRRFLRQEKGVVLPSREQFERLLLAAGIAEYGLIPDPPAMWAEIRKGAVCRRNVSCII